MIDFASKVITYFKADTTDMRAKLRELSADERQLQQQHITTLESRNKSYDDWVGSLGKANQALELVGRAVGFAADSYDSYIKTVELRTAAGESNIDGLKRASLGLRTEQELLEFAAKSQHATFKLTQEQMETAQRAMVALTRAGFDQEEVTNKVTDALVKANGGGLDDFGIAVKDASSDVERFNNLMDALAEKATGVDQASMTSGEAMRASSVSVKESFDRIKQSIGELVASMAPFIKSVAAVVDLTAKALGFIVGIPGGVAGAFTKPNPSKLDNLPGPKNNRELADKYADLAFAGQLTERPKSVFGDAAFLAEFNAAMDRRRNSKVYTQKVSFDADSTDNPFTGDMFALPYADFDAWSTKTSEYSGDQVGTATLTLKKGIDWLKQSQEKAKKKPSAGRKTGGSEDDKLRKEAEKQVNGLLKFAQDIIDAKDVAVYNLEGWMIDAENTLTNGVDSLARAMDPSQLGVALNEQLAALEEERKRMAEAQAAQTMERRMGALEQMFGPIEDFDAYHQGFATLGSVFNTFGEAVGSSYEAIVKGQGGASAAFKRIMADGLMSIGKSSSIEALRETALGLGMLAIGNPKAGLHFQAAAMHASVAVLAGAAARGMGAGGSPAAAGGTSATSGGSASGGSSRGRSDGDSGERGKTERPIQIIVGEWFAEESPRSRRQKADAAVERALRERDE